MVGVVIDGLLTEDHKVWIFSFHNRFYQLRDGKWFDDLIGLDENRTIGADGKVLHIASPCKFEGPERPCDGLEDDSRWRWYTAAIPGKKLVLRQADLPAGFAPSADGSAIAWGRPGAACVAKSLPERFYVVDGTEGENEVARAVWAEVKKRVKL